MPPAVPPPLSDPLGYRDPELPGCQGQQRLEAQLVEGLGDDGYEEHVAGVLAARLGATCLHLATDPVAFALVMALLLPAVHTVPNQGPYVAGAAGLRLAGVQDGRVVLRMWDGHGHLLLHTGAEGLAAWREWKEEQLAEDRHDGRSRLPLGQLEHLHPLEHAELTKTQGLLDSVRSWTLRHGLSRKPALTDDQCRHAQPILPVPRRQPGPHPLGSHRPGPQQAHGHLPPSLLTHAGLADPRPADLGEALAHQLAALITTGRIRTGDVLTDPIGIVTQIGGRNAAARWAQQVIGYVANRYGLLRYRPLRPGDPAPPRQARRHVWAVSEAAAAMVRTMGDEALGRAAR
ncbi:hypothetical protein [Streptomyces klenkii]|uniref:hypothetical protein n=1 Tax=Streptomyces klenkii TaxID=1420899 RepID=UPI0034497458